MTMRTASFIFATVLLGALASGCSNQASAPANDMSAEAMQRLQVLEDREAIRELLVAYGSTIDARDFASFAALFADDADYIGGGGIGSPHGPEAIRAAMEKTFSTTPMLVNGPNNHLFYNVSIDLNGDTATSISKGAFFVQGENNRPEMLILATYHDELVRDGGSWKFKHREIKGNIPAPRAPAAN